MAKNMRVNRADVVRNASERPKNWLPKGAMPMNIDLGPDVKVRYVRIYLDKAGTIEDKESVAERMDRGWELVKPEEVPHLSHLIRNGMIQKSGCVLMKIDANIVKYDVEQCELQAIGAYQAAKRSFEENDNNNSAIKKFSESSKPSIFRGRQPS
jgi:hypothetical protein